MKTEKKGVIYVMTTIVSGLIKIGQTDNFRSRMNQLELHGYQNVAGLKRVFAIEVADYKAKEKLLHKIFEKSQVAGTELFALDVDLVIQLLSSFEGNQIYPEPIAKSKEKVFEEVTKNLGVKEKLILIPNGEYSLATKVKGFGDVKAKMRVKDRVFTVLKGSICAPVKGMRAPKARENAIIENNILQEDVDTDSPSTAGMVVTGHSTNGWVYWKDKQGRPLSQHK